MGSRKGKAKAVLHPASVRYHVQGGTLEAARRKAEKARRERLATVQVAKLGMAGVDLATVLVTRADSVRAGNCAAGTNSFIYSHADMLEGRTNIPADELLKLVDDQYTRAAVLRAITKTLVEGRLEGVALAEEGAGAANLVADRLRRNPRAEGIGTKSVPHCARVDA